MTISNLIISIITLTFPLNIIGQENKECSQYLLAFEYVENNLLKTEFKKEKKLQIDTIVQQCSGIPFMTTEYYAYQMGLTRDEFQKLDTSIRHEIFRKNQDDLMIIDSSFYIDCFEFGKYKRPDLKLSFTRISEDEISICTIKNHKKKKKHKNGNYLIFKFDINNEIKKVFETSWTE